MEKDAGLAAQHLALRKQMAGGAPAQPAADVDPMAGIGDDDFADSPTDDLDFDEGVSADNGSGHDSGNDTNYDSGDDLDFMAKVAAGAKGGDGLDASDVIANISDAAAKTGKSRSFLGGINKSDLAIKAGWGGLAVFWFSLIGLVFMGGETLQSIWPASSQIYTSLTGMSDVERLKAEAETLSPAITDEPEIINAGLFNDPDPAAPPAYRWETVDGENYLALTLIVSNDGRRAASVPKLQITFVNRKGESIGRWIVDPPGRILTRGSYIKFDVRRQDYPVGIYSAVVTVVEGSRSEGEAFERP